MNTCKITAALFFICILISCDEYDLVRTNPHDPKSKNYNPLPELTTATATAITSNSATMGGKVTYYGGDTVIARGVCWSTTTNPTYTNTRTTNGSGKGSFVSSLTGLTPITTYYVRAYAIIDAGTAYGNELSFTTLSPVTDIDGNVYNTVAIGAQVWITENLKTTRYNDGTLIPNVTDGATWKLLTSGAYCWYDNNEAKYKSYLGALYNWYTVETSTLCPTGWHVPSDDEWKTLEIHLGMTKAQTDSVGNRGTDEGTKLKVALREIGSSWSPSHGTNTTGFTAYPGGFCYDGSGLIGYYGYWWSSTQPNTFHGWYRSLNYVQGGIQRNFADIKYGFSVRCLKD